MNVSSWHTQSFRFLPAEVTGCAFKVYSKSVTRERLKRMVQERCSTRNLAV